MSGQVGPDAGRLDARFRGYRPGAQTLNRLADHAGRSAGPKRRTAHLDCHSSRQRLRGHDAPRGGGYLEPKEWRGRTWRRMTAAKLERVLGRYLGDVGPTKGPMERLPRTQPLTTDLMQALDHVDRRNRWSPLSQSERATALAAEAGRMASSNSDQSTRWSFRDVSIRNGMASIDPRATGQISGR